MNESQIEALAAEYAAASGETARVSGTYLRVVVVACQAVLGKVKRGKVAKDGQIQVLEDTSAKYYAAVLRGVTTPDIVHDDAQTAEERTRRSRERNRRSTFARAAKSTLASWVHAGGDIRALDGETVTRDPLLADVRAARGVQEVSHKLNRHRMAILRIIEREAVGDLDGARADLEAMVEALQNAFDALSPNGNVDRGGIVTADSMPVPPPAKRDPLTMTGVMRTRPVHARLAGARA